MSDTLFSPAPDDLPSRSYPQSVGPLARAGAMLPKHRWVDLMAAIRTAEGERIRSGRPYWTFEAYDRIFAAAQQGDGKVLLFLGRALVAMRSRYLRARRDGLSPFQFHLAEQRYRESCDASDRRQSQEHVAAAKLSSEKAYARMVAENELKERARIDARDNVARERGPKKPEVSPSRRTGTSLAPVAYRDSDEYIPPDPF